MFFACVPSLVKRWEFQDFFSTNKGVTYILPPLQGGDLSSFLEKITKCILFRLINPAELRGDRCHEISSADVIWCPRPSCPDSTRPNLNCITRYSTLACCPTIFPLQSVRLNFCQSWWLVGSQWKTTRWDWIPNVSADFNESILEDSLIKLFFWMMLQH